MLADNALHTEVADVCKQDIGFGVECFRKADGTIFFGERIL